MRPSFNKNRDDKNVNVHRAIARYVRNPSANQRGGIPFVAGAIFKKLATTPFYWHVAKIRRRDKDRAFMIAIVRREARALHIIGIPSGAARRILTDRRIAHSRARSGKKRRCRLYVRAIIRRARDNNYLPRAAISRTCYTAIILLSSLPLYKAPRASCKVFSIVRPSVLYRIRFASNLTRTKTSLCKGAT